MKPRLFPVSPALVPMNDPQPMPEQQNLQRVCSGPFCKLPDRVIPEGWQHVSLTINGQVYNYCYHCMLALDGRDGHLMSDNDLFSNRLRPERYACFET